MNYHHLLLKINICRSRSGSNQLEALSIEHPSHIEPPVKAKGNKKVKPTKKKQGLGTKNVRTTKTAPPWVLEAKKHNHLALQWAQEVKEGLVFDFRYACSHIWCHVSLIMFCMKAYLWTWTSSVWCCHVNLFMYDAVMWTWTSSVFVNLLLRMCALEL